VTDGPSALEDVTVRFATVRLTERQRAILDFERTWWQLEGSKESAIREQFALSTTRYYQLLNELLDSPAAAHYDPLVVRRLRRLRTQRRAARFGVTATQPPAR
jgi:hypothetical protein